MKKRDFKCFFKDVSKYTSNTMDRKEKRAASGSTGKVKLPFKMFQGMQKKSIQRHDNQKSYDKEARIVGGSGRSNKLMQNYFVKKDDEKRELKRSRLDTIDKRGMNLHQMSLGKYKNGAIHFSKHALERMEAGDLYGGAYKKTSRDDLEKIAKGAEDGVRMGRAKRSKKEVTYDGVMKKRETNEEWMTGAKWQKKRGAEGKIHHKKSKSKGKKKKFGK